jgi:tetratricopeptide (TPR) repeat protein
VIRAVASALVVLVLLGAAPAVRADDVAEAKARFRRGAELYRASRWREAIAEFEAAYRLKPHGAIHFNVAQCRERLGEWAGALRGYHDYLREVPDANDRAAVRASIRRIEERLAAVGVQALLVYSDPPGAEVRLDGRLRGTTPLHVVLPPGSYRLALALDGYDGVAEEVALAAAASRAVEVALRPAPVAARSRTPVAARDARAKPDLAVGSPPAPGAPLAPTLPESPRERRRVYTWVAAGTAVAAVAAGAYFGVSARRDEDAIPGIVNDPALADRTVRSAESNARRANVLYALAGGASVAGVTLFFVEKRF